MLKGKNEIVLSYLSAPNYLVLVDGQRVNVTPFNKI